MAETDGDDLFDRKSCNLAVTLDIKKGKKIGVHKSQFRGYTYGPSSKSSSYSSLEAEWFFAGGKGEKNNVKFKDDDSNFLVETIIDDDDVTYCECGATSTIFRMNSAIIASKQKASYDDVEIGIDTIDETTAKTTASGYTFYVYEKSC